VWWSQEDRRVGSNVNFFQMKTRQHPYWLQSLCGARKINSYNPIPGQGCDANLVGQLRPKGNLYVNVPLNSPFSFQSLKGLSLQGCVNTPAIQMKHLSVQSSEVWNWHWFSKCIGLAAICSHPSSLHRNFINL
jgi:hypothetical protein